MFAKAGVIASEKTRLRSVPIGAVTMRDGFWKRKMDLNHEHGIWRLLEHLESHGVVDNFKIVSGRMRGERKGPYFSDSDLYKWMEGAALIMQSYDDPKLRAELDRVIDEVVAAQGEDGYLNTFFQGELFGQRFRNLPHEHELYCAGHYFQAAVAHYRATGETKLLDSAVRFADYMVKTFGPGKGLGADGHPEVEMALVELFRATGKREYLGLAEFFLNEFKYKDLSGVSGHAVRALYLACGGADYFVETGDAAYEDASRRMWEDTVLRKMYVTGGVGSRYSGEAFGEPYELPNERAYTETCAAIASAMFNYRLLSIYGDTRYADEMERALYNGVISGVSIDGVSYFYQNPLACYRDYQRQEWFGCTCCPTNMVRTLATVPGYMYSVSDEGVWVHLFDNSKVSYQLADGTPFTLDVKTNYPWDGEVEITVGLDAPKEFTLFVRGSAPMRKTWQPGETVSLTLDMRPVFLRCDPRVRENFGQVAVRRGPFVYCAESVDNPGVPIMDLELGECEFTERREDMLGGIVTLVGRGFAPDESADRGPLYQSTLSRLPYKAHESIKLIPYYAWANRGNSHMVVWMPYRQS